LYHGAIWYNEPTITVRFPLRKATRWSVNRGAAREIDGAPLLPPLPEAAYPPEIRSDPCRIGAIG